MGALRLRFIALLFAASFGTACTANRPHPPMRSFDEALAAASSAVTSAHDDGTQALIRAEVEEFASRCLDARTEAIVLYMQKQRTALRGYMRLSSGWSQAKLCEVDARLLETGLMSKLTIGDDGLVRRERVFFLTREMEAELHILEPAPEEFNMSVSDASTVLYGRLSDGGWHVVLWRGFRLKNSENVKLEALVFGLRTKSPVQPEVNQ